MSLNNKRDVNPWVAFGLIGIFIVAVIGWILNLATLFTMPWVAETAGMLVVRVIGVIIPFIGAVLGFI
jgi:hypothetical protein